jgi:hypothetical protein
VTYIRDREDPTRLLHESDCVVKEAGAGMPRRDFGHFFDQNLFFRA